MIKTTINLGINIDTNYQLKLSRDCREVCLVSRRRVFFFNLLCFMCAWFGITVKWEKGGIERIKVQYRIQYTRWLLNVKWKQLPTLTFGGGGVSPLSSGLFKVSRDFCGALTRLFILLLKNAWTYFLVIQFKKWYSQHNLYVHFHPGPLFLSTPQGYQSLLNMS